MTAHEVKLEDLEKEIRPGKLVVLEGLDGSGKDTQADLLVERCGYIKTRLPMKSSETGKILYKHIENGKKKISEEYFQALMLANYIEHFDNVIKPALDQGKNIVMTRYTPSMVAYADSFGADIEYIDHLVNATEELIDRRYQVHKILLKIPLEVSMNRIDIRAKTTKQKREEVFENHKTLMHVADVYDKIPDLFTDVVDADQSIEKVFTSLSIVL